MNQSFQLCSVFAAHGVGASCTSLALIPCGESELDRSTAPPFPQKVTFASAMPLQARALRLSLITNFLRHGKVQHKQNTRAGWKAETI